MSTRIFKFVLSILSVTICDVIIAVFEAAIWIKSIYVKIVIENQKKIWK